MTNPLKLTIGAVSTLAFPREEAMFTGSFKIPSRYLREDSPDRLTRAQLAELFLQALDTELLSFEAYLDETRGSKLHLPYGPKEN